MVGADGLGSKEDVRVFSLMVLAQFVWRVSSAAISARRPQVDLRVFSEGRSACYLRRGCLVVAPPSGLADGMERSALRAARSQILSSLKVLESAKLG
jgi:hypothetical protein